MNNALELAEERVQAEIAAYYTKTNPEVVYSFGDTLGTGAFSVVKLATHRETKENFAVKIIEKKTLKQKLMVDNEINCWRKLNHKHCVQLKEVYETDQHYSIIQELVSGGELFDKIVEYSFYSEKEASNIILQIVSAINHMHQQGVIHRDLKPENLLLSDKSSTAIIKLADFGLACLSTDLKRLHKAVGTPGYIAPEVLMTLDDKDLIYGKESDIWAIGVILYILLCGYPPFYSDNDDEIFDQTIEGKYQFHESSWSNISVYAKDLIRHLLQVDPKKRWSTKQILEHPWMKGNAPSEHLASTLSSLKKFNAKKRWKAAINTAIAMNRFGQFGKILRKGNKSLNEKSEEKAEKTEKTETKIETSLEVCKSEQPNDTSEICPDKKVDAKQKEDTKPTRNNEKQKAFGLDSLNIALDAIEITQPKKRK